MVRRLVYRFLAWRARREADRWDFTPRPYIHRASNPWDEWRRS